MRLGTHCGARPIRESWTDAAPGADPPDLHGAGGVGRPPALHRVEPLGVRPVQQAQPGLPLPADLEEAALVEVPGVLVRGTEGRQGQSLTPATLPLRAAQRSRTRCACSCSRAGSMRVRSLGSILMSGIALGAG